MNVVYTDESWVNMGTADEKTLKTTQQAFLAGLSTGLKPPTA
jgi:hypothetical protein